MRLELFNARKNGPNRSFQKRYRRSSTRRSQGCKLDRPDDVECSRCNTAQFAYESPSRKHTDGLRIWVVNNVPSATQYELAFVYSFHRSNRFRDREGVFAPHTGPMH